ncbi:membrane protein insertion efficiency factor YidD [Microbacterium sp. C7(2022)]|uniref:membrane protein insertion efficiency factor YidD n=1 Tax=Microbacterium sp. C7(2022) TaxID=2992759 RepID=UPI00237B4B8C|nr:membrane protein insertion efficiency factor YidD [Microbacterium sp. C7(2022)]MDE0546295.1 membrane protein insertion efficiency factor YidD [Microbacterium sp. C7(2022)]
MSVLPAYARGDAHLAASDLLQTIPLLPRNVALGLLHGYRATISHTYGDVCKYYPSCSAYAVGAYQQHGVFKGFAMTAARLARCHPWAQGGVDDVPAHKNFRHALTPHGFVVPSPTGKD